MTPISKPLLAGLLATSVLSVLLLLQPEAAEPPATDDLLAERSAPSAQMPQAAPAWVRAAAPLSKANLSQGFAPPLPPPPPAMPVVVAPPPKPVAPQPSFSYLGRMVRDGQTLVFLGDGNNTEVVALGGTVSGGSWRVNEVTATGVELIYLPLNEARQLAMSK